MADNEFIICGPKANYFQESYGKLLYRGLETGGSKIAMVNAETDTTATYKEILEQTVSLAQHLTYFGLDRHDCISICSENSLYFTIPVISAFYLGITVAPLNHFYTPRELIHAISITKPKIIFCAQIVLHNILEAVKHVNFVQKIIVIDPIYRKLPKNISYMEDLLKLPVPKHFKITTVPLDHLAIVMYSSGTTGHPKGVMLTHKNINAVHAALKHKDFDYFNSSKIGMALLPFFHIAGFIIHLEMILENMKMIVLRRFEEKLFLKSIEKHQISFGFFVPTTLLFLSKSPLIDNYDLSSLKEGFCVAATLGKELQSAVIKRLNMDHIQQGYGLTETTFTVTLAHKQCRALGNVGSLMPGLEAKIIDTKTNQALGPNKRGEMCLRGPFIMKGYYGDAVATRNTIDKEGWLHTGDVAYYDENGYFYIVDRYKELIKYKGYQVPPAEIESLLIKHQQIKDVVVIGKPDEVAGEVAVALVVKQLNATITESEIIQYVVDNVSFHKRLHGGVIFVDSIPKNPTGKILRRLLKEQLKTLSDTL